jgi:hypothetical protein
MQAERKTGIAAASVKRAAVAIKPFLVPLGFDMSRNSYGPIDFNTGIGFCGS